MLNRMRGKAQRSQVAGKKFRRRVDLPILCTLAARGRVLLARMAELVDARDSKSRSP